MIYYPIIIPTLNRYDHFKRCVESLAKNTHADKTELIIGLDYPPNEKYMKGYLKIKAYIPTITGFKNVVVLERKENYGAEKNLKDLMKYVFLYYDAVIGTEDDNEFSPCFLDFMDKALEKYKKDERISSVHGYTNLQEYNLTNSNLLFSHSGGVWGFGQWKNKYNLIHLDKRYARSILSSFRKSWQIFDYSTYLYVMMIAMIKKDETWGDVIFCCKNVLNGWYQVKPRISMVRNWGQDGSGLHCGVDKSFSQQKIQESLYFDFDDADSIFGNKNNISEKDRLNRFGFKDFLYFLYTFVKYRIGKL